MKKHEFCENYQEVIQHLLLADGFLTAGSATKREIGLITNDLGFPVKLIGEATYEEVRKQSEMVRELTGQDVMSPPKIGYTFYKFKPVEN